MPRIMPKDPNRRLRIYNASEAFSHHQPTGSITALQLSLFLLAPAILNFAKACADHPDIAHGLGANAASGMAVHDECKLKFMELKAKRTYRFIVFKIEEKQKQVIVEKIGEPGQSHEDFAASLPDSECRYAVFDYDFVTEENCQKSRIFFIAWSPDSARVRSKMIYASSKDRFKRELDGIQVELQATDPTEMDLDVFKSRAN
ncbi:hypothetical protein OSB04_020833 [Centaurea solstitialis]|uniref:ADF-H domain-containing protein n=1 Tax=Centaurea solstitialis TaxID=347529 RepID=A0AA38T552_9ASTR|nr:hypothetical protein OSB04_020833 [Centaurea solstitialis]